MTLNDRNLLDAGSSPVPVREANVQAFISYSRADWQYVASLAREFRYAGITTWVDTENIQPGDQWGPAIRGAIRSSRAFVFCISPLSMESRRTSGELEEALSGGLIVFPIMIEPTPIESLPEALQQRHILQLFRDPPSIGPKRAAAELARLLGLSIPDSTVFDSGRDTIDALIIRVGDLDSALASQQFLRRELSDGGVVVDRAVTPLDRAGLATISEWLRRCSTAYIVVGDGARSDEIALLCGVASAVLGGKRVNLVCTPAGLPIASRISQLLQAGLIECSKQSDGIR